MMMPTFANSSLCSLSLHLYHQFNISQHHNQRKASATDTGTSFFYFSGLEHDRIDRHLVSPSPFFPNTKYPTPNAAVKAAMDDAYKNNPVIFPPADVLAKCEYAKFNKDLQPLFEEAFTRIKAS